jgi:formamidopyrimidine-DNA glycosylase
MPELPEVEIVRQSLNKKINGKIIKKVIVKNRNLRFKIPLNFTSILKNKRIIKVDRFSKYLIIFLSNDHVCLIHLGMSGTIHLVNKKRKNFITNTSFYHSPTLPKKHNHVEIFFDDLKFIYNDPRRFGYFEIIQNFELLKNKINKFGPEPFSVKFNFDYLHSFLKNKEKNIKNFLLDQRFVSGIGNIYASEILYLSKIKPDKKAKNLTKKELKKILINSKKVLSKAINKGGSSIKDFKNISGLEGEYQKDFKVYQRAGLKCKRFNCEGIIKKKNISNRSTFFCNLCQKH